MKTFAPGGTDEKIQLLANILNPNVCTNARSAQNELIKYNENVKRSQALGLHPPDIMQSYPAFQ